MNLLFVLRGLPGAGKSTFIKKEGFGPYTIEPDSIRMLFGGVQHNITGDIVISQADDEATWALVDSLLEERLNKGITTFIDATSIPSRTLNHYKQLCDKHGTLMYVVDFADVNINTCKERNKQRGFKCVPDEVIDRMYSNLEKNIDVYRKFNIIKPEDVNKILFTDYLKQFKIDANAYEKVIVFGDVHGCHSVLYKAMSEYEFSDKNLYVFVGDMFDRGLENREVLEFCLTFCNKKNFIFLEGNHELHVKKYLQTGVATTPAFTESLKQFGELKDRLKDFYKTLKPLAIISKGKCEYHITHGGIPTKPIALVPTMEYVKGVGSYGDSETVDNAFSERYKDTFIYSIHGHRNIKNVPIHNTEQTYNLEGQVELGGFLRYVEITDTGVATKKLQNTVFDEKLANKHNKSNNVIDSLNNSELIRKKDLGNGIVSYNFTRDAFYKAAWNKQTITARGLFINTDNNAVLARAYPKFFNIEERPETEWRNLKTKLAFPVKAYVKENGFLGIVSYNYKTNELFIASKSTNQGEFAENFKRILLQQLGSKKDWFKNELKRLNCSAIFECIDPVNDPHMIKYDKEEVVLLDVVKNDFTNEFLNYHSMALFADQLGIRHKEFYKEFTSFDELKTYIDTIEAEGRDGSLKIEGYVFVDNNDYMLKYKTPYYRFWKNMRRLKGNLVTGKPIGDKLDDFEQKVIDHMSTYRPEDLVIKSIIEIREEVLTND